MDRGRAEEHDVGLEDAAASRGELHKAIEVSEKELSGLRHECSKITEQKGREELFKYVPIDDLHYNLKVTFFTI